MGPQDADRMTNTVDTDQPAVWSTSTPFGQTCLSDNLRSLRYFKRDFLLMPVKTFKMPKV